MAVTMDLGDANSPFHSSHPRDKKDVGIRLARAGLTVAYGKYVYYTGPLVSEIRHELSLNVFEVVFKSVFGKIEVRSRDGFEVRGQS